MSSEFKQFSEASRLYAQYTEVVEKMEQLFVEDVVSFLDSVEARVQMGLKDAEIKNEDTKEYRSWWLEETDTTDDDYSAYIWMERKNSEIIIPGTLTVIADIDDASDAEKRQLSACKSSLNLPGYCKLLERRLFGVTINYGVEDAVEAVVVPVQSILVALHRVEKKIFAARAKERESKKGKRKK